MIDALAHRGPDADGLFAGNGVALGARRLGIIDNSRAGRQPFASDDGKVQIVYNGEIYNYRELRGLLETYGYSFRSGTDTEVVLAAYRHWGSECVKRFNGMWAFAIWDTKNRQLFCSRDRLGIKPFYYRAAGAHFTFASELKAFRCAGTAPLKPNLPIIGDFLKYDRLDHTDETFFEGVLSLPPGHSLTFDERGARLMRYWHLQPGSPPSRDPAEAVRELVLDSVRLMLQSDRPIGISLSGGIDSSILACAVRKLRPALQMQTFTVAFDDPYIAERPFAEAVVDKINAHPTWVSFSAADLVRNLPAIIESQEEPCNSTSPAAQWFLMQAISATGTRVTLDGQGADELFGGYESLLGYRMADLLAGGRLFQFGREINASHMLPGRDLMELASRTARAFVTGRHELALRARWNGSNSIIHPNLNETITKSFVPDLDGLKMSSRLQRCLATMLRRGLPELLRYLDRSSMAHSVEARVPYLDHRLVELVFSLSPDQLISNGKTKVVLRNALGDLLPDRVLNRSGKLGFPTPETRFFQEELGLLAEDVFNSRSFTQRGWVNSKVAQVRLERVRAHSLKATSELWRSLNLELWARAFLDSSALENEARPMPEGSWREGEVDLPSRTEWVSCRDKVI
jgi:asparagine synthase (glutamine-hydrolysing)